MAVSSRSANSPEVAWKVPVPLLREQGALQSHRTGTKEREQNAPVLDVIAVYELAAGLVTANFWGAPLNELPSGKRERGSVTPLGFHGSVPFPLNVPISSSPSAFSEAVGLLMQRTFQSRAPFAI